MNDLRRLVRDVPDFPRAGIVFKDITPLLLDPNGLSAAIELMSQRFPRPGAVVAIESRGFVFGTGLALRWKVPLIPARKFGKLPRKTVREVYSLEYGEDTLEIHADAVQSGQRVLLIDDLLATGGTMKACCELVEKLGVNIVGVAVLIELAGLAGRQKLAQWPVHCVLSYD